METVLFSKAQLESVSQIGDIKHPIVDLIRKLTPQITTEAEKYLSSSNYAKNSSSLESLRFWPQAIKGIGNFSLEPFELVSIGAAVFEILPWVRSSDNMKLHPLRHRLVNTIVDRYLVQDFSGIKTGELPPRYMESLKVYAGLPSLIARLDRLRDNFVVLRESSLKNVGKSEEEQSKELTFHLSNINDLVGNAVTNQVYTYPVFQQGMKRFRDKCLKYLEEGQELSNPDKMLANHIITSFLNDFFLATGTIARPLLGVLYLIHNRFQTFGFTMPEVENWMKQDLHGVRRFAKRYGVLTEYDAFIPKQARTPSPD